MILKVDVYIFSIKFVERCIMNDAVFIVACAFSGLPQGGAIAEISVNVIFTANFPF